MHEIGRATCFLVFGSERCELGELLVDDPQSAGELVGVDVIG